MAGIPQPNARHLMLSRFRKGKRTVPGTYMSAAGIQTELSPNCLHKVAVHEAVYRKHVNIYRQDLAQKVDKLNKGQNMLKKSMHYYKVKKRENKRKRYHPPSPSSSESDNLFPDGAAKQMLIIVDENGEVSKPMPIKKHQTRSSDSFKSPSLVSDSSIALEFDVELGKDHTTEPAGNETKIETISLQSDEASDRFIKEFAGLSSTSDISKSLTAESGTEHENGTDEKRKTRKKGTSHLPHFNTPRKTIESQSLDNMPIEPFPSIKERKTRKAKSAADTKASAPESLQDVLPQVEDASSTKDIVESWPMANPKKANSRKNQSQTSAFMQLVRMKQSMSMSKHMNMIDKLISGSKNKRLVYLRRISEVSDTGLSKLREQHSDMSGNNNADQSEDTVDHASPPPSRHVKLPPLETEPETVSDNPIEEKYKRAMRKVSVVALQSPEPAPELSEIKTETVRETQSPRPRHRGQREVILRSEQMTSSRDITKFIQSEKEGIALYGKNVTWQESLAKLRDVHYVFPSKILEEKGFTV